MRRWPRTAAGEGSGRRRSPARAAALLVVVLLAVAGSGFLLAAWTAQPPRPPQPAADAAPPPGFDPTGGDRAARPGAAEPVSMDRSAPVRIEIPEIDVDAKIIELGVDEDNQVEVPPLEKAKLAGWYRHGVTPGEIGNAVVIGHVDSYKIGPAVFFYLGELVPGDRIRVVREDGSVAEFEVDGVESYPKDEFPHGLVYGPAAAAQLRVVTCGGEFDKKSREYPDNLVVFASLVSG